jgi:hypothetical protein
MMIKLSQELSYYMQSEIHIYHSLASDDLVFCDVDRELTIGKLSYMEAHILRERGDLRGLRSLLGPYQACVDIWEGRLGVVWA